MPYRLEIDGWMSEGELQQIERWARTVPENGVVVEIGSMLGRSAAAWGLSVPNSAKVYCIDTWINDVQYPATESGGIREHCNSIEEFLENVGDIKTIVAVQGRSMNEISEEIQQLTPNIVFLDASHTNPSDWEYLSFWYPKIKAGGLLCGHDYNGFPWNHEFPDVTKNVKALEVILHQPVTIYSNGGSLWSFQL